MIGAEEPAPPGQGVIDQRASLLVKAEHEEDLAEKAHGLECCRMVLAELAPLRGEDLPILLGAVRSSPQADERLSESDSRRQRGLVLLTQGLAAVAHRLIELDSSLLEATPLQDQQREIDARRNHEQAQATIALFLALDRFAIELLGPVELTQGHQGHRSIGHVADRSRVIRAPDAAADVEGLELQPTRLSELSHPPHLPAQNVHAISRERIFSAVGSFQPRERLSSERHGLAQLAVQAQSVDEVHSRRKSPRVLFTVAGSATLQRIAQHRFSRLSSTGPHQDLRYAFLCLQGQTMIVAQDALERRERLARERFRFRHPAHLEEEEREVRENSQQLQIVLIGLSR